MRSVNEQSGLDLGALLRGLRRRADLSQRELAVQAGVPQATVARIESGATTNPSFRVVEKLTSAAGWHFGAGLPPPRSTLPELLEIERDKAGRRYPAHLDLREVRRPGDWWGAWWVDSVVSECWPLHEVPAVTFDRNRTTRDMRRRRAEMGARVGVRPVVHDSGTCWLAESDGGPVGAAWVRPLAPEVDSVLPTDIGPAASEAVVLKWVFVSPAWRRLGIGARLCAAVQADATTLVLTLAAGFAARRFLQSCGFLATYRIEKPIWYARGSVVP
ncbi:hypothetical protein KRMM14A1259_51470 [Krasilnikovia sp. MM14-A1259]